MPHKKNPDVFELIRARCNKIQALPNEIAMMTANLPSGYHRDLQLLKESLFPAIGSFNECIEMTRFMLENIIIKKELLENQKYAYLFSVEAVNAQVLSGVPFREAYKNVGMQIENGTFAPDNKIAHTHEGSIGNLCNDEIAVEMKAVLARFTFDKVAAALNKLIE